MELKQTNDELANLSNTMICAEWLVGQFEEMDYDSIANIFQRAVDDAYAWIKTMENTDIASSDALDSVRAREAAVIHSIIRRYSLINDSVARNSVLDGMLSLVASDKYNET